jgi:hypothetical protein
MDQPLQAMEQLLLEMEQLEIILKIQLLSIVMTYVGAHVHANNQHPMLLIKLMELLYLSVIMLLVLPVEMVVAVELALLVEAILLLLVQVKVQEPLV